MKLLLLIPLFTISSFSQTLGKKMIYQVNYELVSAVYGNKIITDYILLSSESESIYLTQESFSKINNKENFNIIADTINNKGEITNIVKVDTKNHLFYTYKDFEKDSLTFTNFANEKSYKVSEKNISFDWVITDEEKIISSYKCKKAVTHFRGRDYIAWFSEEIPIFNGPFKFNDLPGLIVEIYDSELKYSWIAKSIQLNKDLLKIEEPNLKYKLIDIKTSVIFSDKELINLVSLNQSRLPQNVTSEGLKIKRGTIELKYEWEE
ncbi:GLPGLI family protein [Flavobacterium ardleyense]|uniref:GLPGLI family protein n=1 Tax=Flavobacterium ardleyense TaxID=2038737 RepID=A0ABW5Z7P2_9FLAO